MSSEKWLPVAGYEGSYEVSDQGRVRSLDRRLLGKDGRTEFHAGKVLIASRTARGYCEVSLRAENSRKHRTIHSLVAETFLGPRPAGNDVMHINGDRTDNRLQNLRYGTRKENLNQTYEYGGRQGPGKLTKDEVSEIRQRLEKGEKPTDLAKEYGVHSAAIYHIRNGTTFKWLREEVV